MVLILAVCLFSMATHFFLESMGVDGLFSQGPQIAGHYDDTFILGSLPISGMIGLLVRLISQQSPAQRSFGIPVPLPPPNC
jgi:hypothetical protein